MADRDMNPRACAERLRAVLDSHESGRRADVTDCQVYGTSDRETADARFFEDFRTVVDSVLKLTESPAGT